MLGALASLMQQPSGSTEAVWWSQQPSQSYPLPPPPLPQLDGIRTALAASGEPPSPRLPSGRSWVSDPLILVLSNTLPSKVPSSSKEKSPGADKQLRVVPTHQAKKSLLNSELMSYTAPVLPAHHPGPCSLFPSVPFSLNSSSPCHCSISGG